MINVEEADASDPEAWDVPVEMPGLASVGLVDDFAEDVGGLEVEVGVTAVPVTGSSVIGQNTNLN